MQYRRLHYFACRKILSSTTITAFVYRTLSTTTLVSRYQNVSILDSIGANDDGDGEVTHDVVRRAKLQLNHHHEQITPSFLHAGYPSCSPTNSLKTQKGFHGHPHSWSPTVLVFQPCRWPLNNPGYLGECSKPLFSPLTPVPTKFRLRVLLCPAPRVGGIKR